MFNGMISPVSPYKICAVIYYQGESDVGHPNRYALEFRALVNDWRKSWKEKQLPIIYVQLAGFPMEILRNRGRNGRNSGKYSGRQWRLKIRR